MIEDKIQIINRSYEIRGKILHLCTILEKDIEDFICQRFTDNEDKAGELFVIILDRMNFDSKISALETILKKGSGDDFEKKFGKLLSELRYTKEHRNIMAHYIVNVFDGHKPLKQGVDFIGYRNMAIIETYDKGKFELVIKRIAKCIEVIRKIEI